MALDVRDQVVAPVDDDVQVLVEVEVQVPQAELGEDPADEEAAEANMAASDPADSDPASTHVVNAT